MEDFAPGDIVEHKLLEVQKVVVGAGQDRYLCVRLEDVDPDGHVRVHARVAMHRGANLRKIGFREGVEEISLDDLYHKEMSSRHFLGGRLFRGELLTQGLLIVAAVMIVLAILSGVDYMRNGLTGWSTRKSTR